MVEPTSHSRLLAAVSVAQLATGVAGMLVALRRRHPYDVFWMHGRADAIARDTIVKGTALSAPVSNLLVQAALTAVVSRRPSRGAVRALGGLGALQVAGYLGERLVRRRLRPSGWDAVETPLVVAGIGLAGAMAALASQVERRGGAVRSPIPVRACRGRGRRQSVREGTLYGGLPYLAVGPGPPLVVFSGLSAEHAHHRRRGRRFFAEDGTLIHYADEPQLLAISTDQLRRIPHVIGIAVGIDKAKAVVGAARAGLISTLVTDTVTARAIAGLLD